MANTQGDPQLLALILTIVILNSIFLGWVSQVTPGLSADTAPDIYKPKQIKNYTTNLAGESIENATGLSVYGGWQKIATGWESTGDGDTIYLSGINVNGYGEYDNTYRLSNPNSTKFNVFISVPTGIVGSFTSLLGANKAIYLQVDGNSFRVPTATLGGIWSEFVNADKKASANYNRNDFKLRTIFNETGTNKVRIFVDNTEIISASSVGVGYFYLGQRTFGGIEALGQGLILKEIHGNSISVTTDWYGDPVTGFLLGAWNFFKTAFAFFVWDFSYPPEWAFVMNGIYLVFVRIPCYIALFIGIRLLRG